MALIERDIIWVGRSYSPSRWRVIVARVAAQHKITVDDLLGSSRLRFIAWPRQQAFAEIREGTSLSWPQIGAKFNRDHTTALYGARRHQEREAARTPLPQ